MSFSCSFSSIAASKASSPEAAAPVSNEGPLDTEDAVQSSADAGSSDQTDQTDQPNLAAPDEVSDSTPSAPQEEDAPHPSNTPDDPSGSSTPEEGEASAAEPEQEESESAQSWSSIFIHISMKLKPIPSEMYETNVCVIGFLIPSHFIGVLTSSRPTVCVQWMK